MADILRIFKRDMCGIFRNVLVLIIVIGLCVLPALYAWFNIYANWDPYGNTGNIAIAVVNLDKGWTKNDSETVNMGDGVVESLKQKDTIGWKFVKSEEKAVEGVKSGRYYSALVIDEQFTYSMYHGVADNIENPRITYYLNDKKNAVATKITDSAASAVKSSINKQFIKVLAEQVFKETNVISDDMKEKDAVGQMTGKLEAVSESLAQYDAMIRLLTEIRRCHRCLKKRAKHSKMGRISLQRAQTGLKRVKMICSPPDNPSTALVQISHRH